MKTALLNAPVITRDGNYTLRTVDLNEARKIVENEFESFIGHQSTADIMTTLLDTEIPMHRGMFAQEKGQDALIFKLNGRPEEGKVLTVEEIQEIGYSFQLLTRNE